MPEHGARVVARNNISLHTPVVRRNLITVKKCLLDSFVSRDRPDFNISFSNMCIFIQIFRLFCGEEKKRTSHL